MGGGIVLKGVHHEQFAGVSSPAAAAGAGVKAPEFSLHSTPDQTVSLREARGRPVVLIVYPADWSPVCGSELALFNELLPEFHKYNAALACISVDGAWCHIATGA